MRIIEMVALECLAPVGQHLDKCAPFQIRPGLLFGQVGQPKSGQSGLMEAGQRVEHELASDLYPVLLASCGAWGARRSCR